jgi:MFS family permease
MGRLSVSAAWNESAEFLKAHFGALFTVALALIALPEVALQAFGPAAAAPGEVTRPGLWLLLLPVVLVLGLTGSLAISTLAMGREAVVGDALRHGLRRMPAMLGASLLVLAGLGLVLGPLGLALGLRGVDFAAPTPAIAGRVLIFLLLAIALLLFTGVRLLLMTPAAAAEAGGPLAVIARSWALTRGHAWKLLGFLLLMSVAMLVVLAAVTSVVGILVGLVAGPPQPGTTGGLVVLLAAGLVNAAFVTVTTTIVARLYLQSAGGAGSVAAD